MASFIKTLDDAMKVAVYSKFATYLGLSSFTNDIVFAPKSVSQRRIAEKRGKDSVEFISLWRNGLSYDWNRGNANVARKGIQVQYTNAGKTSMVTVKAVPIKMEYELRFWSRDLDKINNAIESYFFWYQNNPNLILNYLDLYPLELDMHFGSVTDESPIDLEYDKGLYFVYSMPITLDGFVFSPVYTPTIKTVILDVWIRENRTDITNETLGDAGLPRHRTGTLLHKPIENTLTITDGVETFSDNGEGLLISDMSGSTDGTIDYYHLTYDVTFANIPAMPITADYSSEDTFVFRNTIESSV